MGEMVARRIGGFGPFAASKSVGGTYHKWPQLRGGLRYTHSGTMGLCVSIIWRSTGYAAAVRLPWRYTP